MATAKPTETDETTTPKTNILTFAKGATAAEKMAAVTAAKKALENEALEEIDGKIAELEKQLEGLRNERNAILPLPPQQNEHPAGRPRSPKAAKAQGIQVSANRLGELVKEAGGELSIRSRKGSPAYDIESVKKAIDESKGKFKLGGKSPWPTVVAA